MYDHASQIPKLFGVEPPEDFFEFYEWFKHLDRERRSILHTTVGVGLAGLFDVLAGRFQNVELRYPAVLHWRYFLDPPEFFTVLTGDSDGLHYGYWFDDPGRRAPVIAAWYARDAFQIWSPGSSLFETIHNEIVQSRESVEDDAYYFASHPEERDQILNRLELLEQALPEVTPGPIRQPDVMTPDGMGVILSESQQAGRGGELLLEGKFLWAQGNPQAFEILEEAYTLLGRDPLANVVRAHGRYPNLPRIDILEHTSGDYHSLDEALSEPEKVMKLELGEKGLNELPDLSSLLNLKELKLWGNDLTDLPESLASCRKLKVINLYRNALNAVPSVLFELRELEEVSLGRNQISTLGNEWKKLPKLRHLFVRDNPLSQHEVDALREQLPKVQITF